MNNHKTYLEPITKDEFNKIIKIKFHSIIDGFNNYKNMNLKKNKVISNDEAERNFIKFIIDSYNINIMNKTPLIIDFYLKELDEKSILNLENMLDTPERKMLNDIKWIKEYDTNYFIIKDISIIPFFVKLCTKEIFFITFYFIDKPMTIWGNYNYTFPIFYDKDEILNQYKKLAIKNNNLIE